VLIDAYQAPFVREGILPSCHYAIRFTGGVHF